MAFPPGSPGAHRNGPTRARGRMPGRSGRSVRTRRVANWINLSTPAGLLVARYGRSELTPGPYGVVLARNFSRTIPFVRNRAMTIGDVVLLVGVDEDRLRREPQMLEHEARHCGQYAYWPNTLIFWAAYGLASAWSWARTRNPALRNVFEVRAGLVEGGYVRE